MSAQVELLSPEASHNHHDLNKPIRDYTGSVRHDGCIIGDGGFGLIFKGRLLGSNDAANAVAIKVPRVHRSGPIIPREHEKVSRRLIREAKVWNSLAHPNITPFLGTLNDTTLSDIPCLLIPFYPFGDAYKYLREHPGADRLTMILQVAKGVRYLHQLGVVHGDIKANNILIDNQHTAMLTDFGLSRVTHYRGFTTEELYGNWYWMAPELLNYFVLLVQNDVGTVIKPPKPTAASDVWAFAMTVLEIYTERPPFHNIHKVKIADAVATDGVLPQRIDCPEVPEHVWNVLSECGCWERLPEKRCSIDVVIAGLSHLM